MKTLQCLSVIFAVLLFGQITFAQNDSAILSGTVYDLSNQGIPKVKIKARNKNPEVFESVANLSGDYSISLKPGEYELEFYAEGFRPTKISGYKVGPENTVQLDVVLDIQQITEYPLPESSKNEIENVKKSFLRGTVYDSNGSIIQKTKVKIKTKTDKSFDVVTDETGMYKIELVEGIYSIEFYAVGFNRYKIDNYKIAFDSNMQLDICLEVGAGIHSFTVPANKKRSKIIKRKNK